MVRGIEQFKKHFADFTDRYVLIGGTASTLAMDELGIVFMATKDLDIVLCIEALDTQFVEEFWRFVQLGGCENKQKSTGESLFYRFYSAKDSSFPEMLELISRVPDVLGIAEDSHLTPIPVGSEVSSLSAILMDDAYYSLIHDRRRVVSDLSIIGAECLIPLKARAYLDLFANLDVITPNEIEAETLTGIRVETLEDAQRAGEALLAKGVGTAILTLGSKGAYVVSQSFTGIRLPAKN